MAASPKRSQKVEAPSLREATVVLHTDLRKGLPDSAATHRDVAAALEEARARTGLVGEATKVLDNVRSFNVRAPTAFIEALSKSRRVSNVVTDEPRGSAFIEPIDPRPVELPDEK